MLNPTPRGTWTAAIVVAVVVVGVADVAAAGRPTGLRYPTAGAAVLNASPQVAWSPGELGVCACALPAVTTPAPRNGLELEFFRGTFGGIPDYTQLSPVNTTVSNEMTVASFAADDLFALRFRGRITIPSTGNWIFRVTADDSARLFVAGVQRVNIDGLRSSPATVDSSSVAFSAGPQTLEMQYVRNGTSGELGLFWSGPGMTDGNGSPVFERVPTSAYTFVPTLSTACAAAFGQASCSSDAACGAGFFCTADATDPQRAVGVCQPVAQTPLCIDSTGCGNDTVCASPVTEGGTTVTEASFSCPPNALGCDLDAGSANAPVQGVSAEFYRGFFTALPDFDQLIPLDEITATRFGLPAFANDDGFAYRERAFVDVPIAGSWDFFVTSDDGSKLFIDKDLIVNNDFLHGPIEAQGSKFLTAGRHEFEVQFFERFGGATLRVEWQLRDGNGAVVRAREEIPNSVLSFVPLNRISCTSADLSCAPPLAGALPRGVDHFVELTQISTVRGVQLRQRVQRQRFTIAQRVQYSVEVARSPTFATADSLFSSNRLTQVPGTSTLRLPFTQTTSETLLERREAEASQLVGDCGRASIDGIIFQLLCSNAGAVTLNFNAPSSGTYRFRTRVTGDQTFGGSIPAGSAVNDPVLVQFRLDSSIVPGETDDPNLPETRRGKRAVTANRAIVDGVTGRRQTQELLLDLNLTPGPHSVTMSFINDFCCTPSDRNLWVDFLEVSGPAETQTILSALSQGPVFWRVNAFDGLNTRRASADTRIIDMPDLTPPKTPLVSYPEENALLLSTKPGVTWGAVADAARYEVTFTDVITGAVERVETTTNAIDGPASPLDRGTAYTVEVRALDVLGNASPPSPKRRITIANRVSYRFQASRDATFTPQSLIFEGPTQTAPTFGPLDVPVQAQFSQKISSVGSLSSGSDCGVTGDGYQLLCGGGQFRDHAVAVPTTGTYVLTFDAFQTMGGPDDTRMEVTVDQTVVDTIVVPNLRSSPGTFRLSATMTAGVHTIRVRFVNDYCCVNTGRPGESGDRNLFIRSVTVDGPANVPTLRDLFALGPLFWRVVATDGNQRSTNASPAFLVEFPDRTPPAKPIIRYPEDAAVTAALDPVFAWDPVPDAVAYDIVVNDGVSDVINRRVTTTIVNDIVDLSRGSGYLWTVRAVDANNNISAPAQQNFRIGDRLTYDFLSSTAPTFSPENLILTKENLKTPRLETAGLNSQAVTTFAEAEALEGTGCGLRDRFVTTNNNGNLVTITDGNKYQVLCTNSQNRTTRFLAPETGLYRVKIFASADQVSGQQVALMALTGGRRIEVPIVRPRLAFDSQTVAFTANQTITGARSGATAFVTGVTSTGGGVGFLDLTLITGTFRDDEAISGSNGGAAVVNGAVSYPLNGSPVNYTPNPNLANQFPGREEYIIEMPFEKGPQSLKIEFINEFCCSPGDKNLLVDNVTIQGPLNDSTVIAALSRGPVYWTAVAHDQTNRTNQPNNAFVVNFPDLIPPKPPKINYPLVNDNVLDTQPAITWAPITDATSYRVTLTNLSDATTQTVTTSDIQVRVPQAYPRGTVIDAVVTAIDESGNQSTPSSPVRFSIANRLNYTLQASLDFNFSAAGIVYEERGLGATRVGPMNSLFVDPPVAINRGPFDAGVGGNNCGSVVAAGQVFVNLCGQDFARDFPIELAGDNEQYEIAINAFGVTVNTEPARMELQIDGLSLGTFDVPGTSSSPDTIRVRTAISRGSHLVRARFTNDFCCSPADRNLFVGNLSVNGPVGNETLLSRLSQGDIYWRVVATDGIQRTRTSETRIIGFPDLKPPTPAIPVYPELGAVVLSTTPAITFTAPPDAARFRLRVVDAAGALAFEKDITSSTFTWDEAPLVRGTSYNWTVRSVDAAGNVSTPSTLQPFSVDNRVRYVVEAATKPADATGRFPEADIITRVADLREPRLPLSRSIAVPVNITSELEVSSAFGASCGVASGSGRNWVNICSNGTRSSMVRIENGAEYRITATLSGQQTLPTETFGAVRAGIVVDGTIVSQFDVLSQFPNQLETKSVNVRLGAGAHAVGVAFLNDFCCTPSDRNLLVDKVVIDGPTNNTTFSDLFSRGDVYWNVRAIDGLQRDRRSSDTRVVAFPDLLPPDSPKITYPEENAALLAARPVFTWSSIVDAARYKVELLDLDGNATIPIADTTATSLVLPSDVSDLLRGGRYSVAVRAVDAANNQSFNPTPVVFSVANRVNYAWEAATTPTFAPESQIVRVGDLTETSLDATQPVEPLFRKKVEAEGTQTAVSSTCGASGGFVNLCGNGSEVGMRVELGGAPAKYTLNARLFATQGPFNPATLDSAAQAQVRVDGAVVTSVPVFATAQAPKLQSFTLNLNPGSHIISIRFPNDFCCTGGDRNLFVDFLELTGPAGISSIESKLRVGPVFWRVTARDDLARARDANNPFVVDFPDETPPAAPLPIYPEDSASILSTTPGFRWSRVLDAASYRIVVIDEATALEVVQATVPAGQETFDPDGSFRLDRGLRYRWFVEAIDAAGNRSPDPAQRVFTIGPRVTYEIQLATASTFEPASQLATFPVTGATRKQFRTIDLPQAGTAFYRVVAEDGTNAVSLSTTHLLSLPDTKPPNMVRMLYPEDGIQVLDATVGFAWTEQEPNLDYELEVGTSAAFAANTVLFRSRAKGNFVRLPAATPLQPNSVYFWRIRAIDSAGNASLHTTPARLSLRSKTRSTYTLEVSTQSFHLNPQPVYVATTTSASCDRLTGVCGLQLPPTQPLQQNTTYFWRVKVEKTVDSEPPIKRARTSVASSAPTAGEALTVSVGQFVPEPGGVIGNYFKDREFRIANGLRQDAQIDFPRLADGDPFGDFGGLTGTTGDSFSVRWTGLVFAPKTGTYKFIGVADDNQQLLVNGTRLFAVTQFLGAQRAEGSINLTEGWHFFAYEMVENTGSAFAQLSYRCDNCSPAVPEQIIPSNFLAIPRSNTDNKAPVARSIYLASAMPATATTPGRGTLHLDLNEAATVEVTINDDGVTRVVPPARVGVTHDIDLGNVTGNFTYSTKLTDLNNNVATTPPIAACAPLESDLTSNEIRATYFSQTNLTGRVLDEAQATINFTGPSAAALPLVGADEFSVRWHGGLFIAAGDVGANRFTLTADDGHRFAVDGLPLLNDFVKRGGSVNREVQATLGAGWHEIDLGYLQGSGSARSLVARTTPGGFTQSPLANSTLASINLDYLRPRFSAQVASVTLEAQSPNGTVASLSSLTASDCRDPAPVVSNNAPALFPLGTTNVAWTARNRFNEAQTLVQQVRVVDTTAPTILTLLDQTVPCNSPDADGRTPSNLVTLQSPTTSDNADPAPLVTFVTPPQFVLDQPADVTVIARDFSGNEARGSFKVTTTDVGALSLSVNPDVTAGRADNCTLGNGALGTVVKLPIPTVTNLCLASSPVTFTHDLPAPATGEPSSDEICLPLGTSVVRWTGQLGSRVGAADVRVRVFSTNFNVVVDSAPRGYVNTNATVQLHLECRPGEANCFAVFDAAGVRRVQWRILGTDQPATTTIGDTGTFAATFTAETRQCPMNIVVIDAVGRQGTTQEPCFAIDKTPPSVSPGDLPVKWVDAANYTVAVDAAVDDVTTWPHAFVGEDIDLTLGATDNDGAVPSGIRSLVATMEQVPATGPAVEVFRTAPTPVDDGLGSGPAGVLEFCTSPLCTNGKLDLAKLGQGNWRMRITSTDAAGNTANAERFLSVRDLFGALDALYVDAPGSTPDTGWLAVGNFNAVTTDSGARLAASRSRTALNRVRSVLIDKPGSPAQALLVLRNVATDLASTSISTSFLRGYMARASASDVRRLSELHEAEGLTDWNMFGPSGRYLAFQNGSYTGRQHIARPTVIFAAVDASLDAAALQLAAGRPSEALTLAANGFDELSLVLDDRVIADFYGREPFYLVPPSDADPDGTTEFIYENAFASPVSSDYGRNIAAVVQNQIDRAIEGPGVAVALKFAAEVSPTTTCTTNDDCAADDVCNAITGTCFGPGPFNRVSQRVTTFREGVEALDCRGDATCTGRKIASNKEFFEDIYLSVQDSFADLAAVQGQAFATHTWRQGIGLTLTYVLNFTVYSGERPLVVIAPSDPVTIESECWWARMTEALDGGDAAGVNDALALFQDGRCLNVEIYNKFYGGAQQGIVEDVCVDPSDYGCPTDGTVHATGGCLRVAASALPTVASMCGPLSP